MSAPAPLERVAVDLGVSVGSLSRIERGEQWPDQAFFERMISLTNGAVTPNDFVLAAPPAGQTELAGA